MAAEVNPDRLPGPVPMARFLRIELIEAQEAANEVLSHFGAKVSPLRAPRR